MNEIGSGVSELNPAVVEELKRLRSGNAELTSRLSAASEESVRALEERVDDLEVKCEGYKGKFESEKEGRAKDNGKAAAMLKSTRGELEGARSDLARARRELEKAESDRARKAREVEEEKGELRERFSFATRLLRDRGESNAAQSTASLAKLVGETTEKFKKEKEALAKAESEFGEYKAKHSFSNGDLAAKQKEYKHKLSVAGSNISSLEDEVAQQDKSRRAAYFELGTLKEEMKKIRAQGQNMTGAEHDFEIQNEALQNEYARLHEENKVLKEGGGGGGGRGGERRGSSRRKEDHVSAESLKSLTTSYEARIATLNEERRELVMNNTSAAKNLQMAETKNWQLDQEIASMKEQLCELRLELERALRGGRGGGGGGMGGEEAEGQGVRDKENVSENVRGRGEGGGGGKQRPVQTLVESVQSVNVGGEAEGEPECKQS